MTTRAVALLGLTLVMGAAAVGVALGGGNGGMDTAGAQILRLTVNSKATGERLPLRVVVPEGGGVGRPIVVFLHGRGQTPDGLLSPAFFEAFEALGDRAPVVALPYGGDHSYWHDRRDGGWGRYVVREVLPRAIDATDADAERVAVGGISMGGFGAYDVARLNPKRFCAVGGHSPALWGSADATAPGAFDDAADFNRHDVIRGAGRLSDLKVWLDIGRADPFLAGARAFADAAEGVNAHFWAGGHEGAYWDRHWDEYLRFYARALRRCG